MNDNTEMLRFAETVIDSYGCRRENLIAIMQDIQGRYKYLRRQWESRLCFSKSYL